MIGKLKGTIDEIGEDHLVVDVGGVGYVAFCGARTLAAVGEKGTAVSLLVETYVREDMIRLYGFATAAERDWFRALQLVQSVGAKVALAVVGTLSPAELADAVALQDRAAVARAPGVGPKVAARIVAELKDRAPASLGGISMSGSSGAGAEIATALGAPAADAVSALVNLGYGRDQAAGAVAKAVRAGGEGQESAALIRAGLRELAR